MKNFSALQMRRLYKMLPNGLRNKLKAHLLPMVRGKVIYETRTPYNNIQVIDKGNRRYLVFLDDRQCPNVQFPEDFYQSYLSLVGNKEDCPPYAAYCHSGFLFKPGASSILMVGLGGGVIPRQFLEYYPGIREFRALEIDQEVVRVAGEYFDLPRDPRLQVLVGDGRELLEQDSSLYDLILLDAFLSRNIPYHLATVEFFQGVQERLTDGGVMLMNVYGALQGGGSEVFLRIVSSLKQIFENIYLVPDLPEEPEQMQSIIVAASNSGRNILQEDIFAAYCGPESYRPKIKTIIQNIRLADGEEKEPYYDTHRPESGLLALFA